MAIKDIEREMDKFAGNVKEQLHRVDMIVGETFIRNARLGDTYQDDTGNLRNSIGYIAQSPEGTVKAFDGRYTKRPSKKGQQEGALHAEGLRSEVHDIGLIMVAGMNYGPAVEAKGYDVISNSVEQAKEQHQRLVVKTLRI